MARKELDPGDITIICDTREQRPFDFAPLRSEPGTLATGDYSIKGLENFIALERKSLGDLISCVGVERERFDRECQRLLAYQTRAIVVEAAWAELERGDWRSQVTPQAAMGSVLGWMALGIPVVFAGSRGSAQTAAARIMFLAARRHWRAAQSFLDSLKLAEPAPRAAPKPP